MLQLTLPSVIPQNETAPVPASGLPKVLHLPVPENPPAPETNWLEMVEALDKADRFFQRARELAVGTRDREQELEARIAKLEADLREQQEAAQNWQSRYEVMEHKIPWWVKKLCGAQNS